MTHPTGSRIIRGWCTNFLNSQCQWVCSLVSLWSTLSDCSETQRHPTRVHRSLPWHQYHREGKSDLEGQGHRQTSTRGQVVQVSTRLQHVGYEYTSIKNLHSKGTGHRLACIQTQIAQVKESSRSYETLQAFRRLSPFYRDDTELLPTFKIKPTKKDEDCTLQVNGLTLKMSGTYKCVAVNPAGQAVCAAQITVTGMCSLCWTTSCHNLLSIILFLCKAIEVDDICFCFLLYLTMVVCICRENGTSHVHSETAK